jgi:hypothetical protein
MLLALAVALLIETRTGEAGPAAGGNRGGHIKLDAGARVRLPAIVFKGNERACVIFIGDHDPVVDLVVSVFDDKGKLVARDDPGSDFCVAIWFPAHDASYTIELENRGREYNKCWLAIK